MRFEKLQTKPSSPPILKCVLVCLIKKSNINKELWEVFYQRLGLILSKKKKKSAELNQVATKICNFFSNGYGTAFEIVLLLTVISHTSLS